MALCNSPHTALGLDSLQYTALKRTAPFKLVTSEHFKIVDLITYKNKPSFAQKKACTPCLEI